MKYPQVSNAKLSQQLSLKKNPCFSLLDVLEVIDDIMHDFDFTADLDLSSISPHHDSGAYSTNTSSSSYMATSPTSTVTSSSESYEDNNDMYTSSNVVLPSMASYKSPVTIDPMLAAVPSPDAAASQLSPSQYLYAPAVVERPPQQILKNEPTPTTTTTNNNNNRIVQPKKIAKKSVQIKAKPKLNGTPIQLQQVQPGQVIALQGNGKQLLFQTNPTVMYTTSNGTPISTAACPQNVHHALVNGTLTLTTTRIPVVMETSSNASSSTGTTASASTTTNESKVPISRISVPKVKEVIKVVKSRPTAIIRICLQFLILFLFFSFR